MYCFTCITAARQHQVIHKRGDTAFVRNGFSDWKDATVSFRKHEASAVHTDAVQGALAPKTRPDVAEMLSSELARQKADNRQCLLKILSNLMFLARQGLAICGSGDDKDSNFTQLLKLRSEDDGRIVDWLSKKRTSMRLMTCRIRCCRSWLCPCFGTSRLPYQAASFSPSCVMSVQTRRTKNSW